MATTFKNSFKGDRVIWMVFTMLSLLSIVAVFSSVSILAASEKTSAFFFLLKQCVFVVFGFVIAYIFHNIPISVYRKFASLALYFSIALLVVAIALGRAFRWLPIPFTGLTFQPSDIAKVGLIIYLAKVLEEGGLDTYKKVLIKLIVPIGVVCLLIFWGNISTSILLGTTCFCAMFLGGVKMKHLLNTVGLVVITVALAFAIGLKTNLFPRVTTAVSRVMAFSQNKNDVTNDSFQAHQAKIAVATGGIIGKGPGSSTQRFILPKAESDFIYAIIVEEYGLFGGIVVLLAYLWLLYRAVVISRKCTRMFPVILVLGLMLLIVFQAMINMGVSVGVFPVTGQTLPLVSQGGTSMVLISSAIGIILAISRTADQQSLEIDIAKEEREELEQNKQKA